MTLSDLSIQRPVTTWMMMAAVLLFGVLGYARLGVDQFPSIEFPIVTVTAFREGASPEVMEEDVTDVLEEYLNTIAGLRTIHSQTLHGIAQIFVEFELEVDIDVAAQDVRDKLSLARLELPTDLDPPIVQKVDTSGFPVMWIPVVTTRPVVETNEYVRLEMKPALGTIPGVGAVEIIGRADRNIRIWLDGDALRARGLAVTDVADALEREHVEIPGGEIMSEFVRYTVKTDAEFRTLAELENLVVAYQGGAPIHLSDVGRVEDGSEDIDASAYYNGARTVGLGVLKQPGANTVAVADEIYKRLEKLRETAPEGLDFGAAVGTIDFSRPIREAVAETQFALVLGALLATLTVFVFLRRWRPTLIVGAAIPLSLIGSFGAMWIFGFTLNVMTLLALAVAVGVVIDDAIVVLENIERHRERGEGPFEAAAKGTREIAFAATAATISIAVIFLPVVFATGIVGNFLREFGGTVASAVMISLFVALTLTPMLAARMPPPRERAHGSIYHRLELGFRWLEVHYGTALDWTLSHRTIVLLFALGTVALSAVFARQLGTEFFPPEDQGRVMVRFDLPAGGNVAASVAWVTELSEWLEQQPEILGTFVGIGVTGPDSPGTQNQGVVFNILHPRAERERSAHELIEVMRAHVATLPDARATVSGTEQMAVGGDSGVEFDIRGRLSLPELAALADEMIAEMEQRGGFVDLDRGLKLGLPEVRVVPDRAKAAALGVDAASLARVIHAGIGGIKVGTFKESGTSIDIRMRLESEARDEPEEIGRLYVRGRDGALVELRNLVTIETGAAPSVISRRDRLRSARVRANLDGKELGEAVEDIIEIAARVLPPGVELGLAGSAEELGEGNQQFAQMLLLAILVIYMVLGVQFESFIHPFTVLLALPLAMVGAFGGLWVFGLFGKPGMTINLFSMIGIILLLGLVTKNSILLVDYANQLRREGMEKVAAMRAAPPVRMRPVLMTAISMIFGVLPAALGLGPGSETRAPMGVATSFGMLSSTLLTLLVVPVFYLVLDDGVEWVAKTLRRLAGRDRAPAAADRA